MKKVIKVKKSLRLTNPHLQDRKKYEKDLIENVISSSRIEGINITKKQLAKIKL